MNEQQPAQPAKTKCGACGGSMVIRRHPDGATFSCTQCDQLYTVVPGRISQAVLPRLYPTSCVPGTALWLELVEYRCVEWARELDLQEEADIPVTQEQRDSIEAARRRAIQDHSEALKSTPNLWQKLKGVIWTGSTK